MAIRKRGKSWQVDVSMGVGHRVREDWPDRASAKKREAELAHEYRQGKRRRGCLVGLTFGEAVALWLEEAQGQHEPDTYRYYRERVQPATKVLGTMPLRELGRREVLEYVAAVKALTSPVTARKTLACIQTCLRWAIKNEYIETSTILSIPLPRVTPERRIEILTDEEMVRVLGAANQSESLHWKQRGVLLLLSHAGLRRREVQEFSADWLHPEERMIEIPAWAQFRPKSKRARYVPMSDELLEWAAAWPTERHHLLEGERNIAQIRRVTRRAQRLLGGRKRVTPHILRHSYASMLERRGASLQDIQAILGHNDITTTARYVHPLPGHVERVGRLVTRNVTSERPKQAKNGTRPERDMPRKPASTRENSVN